jgi:anti-sigma factor RsiW
MSSTHFTENELQQYAEHSADVNPALAAHIATCGHCQAKVNNYRLIFGAIHAIEKPVFDFDVAAMVMAQLPAPALKRKFPWAMMCTIIFVLLIFTVAVVAFQGYFMQLFKGISMIILSLIVFSAACVLVFQGIELFNNHKKQMRVLDML